MPKILKKSKTKIELFDDLISSMKKLKVAEYKDSIMNPKKRRSY